MLATGGDCCLSTGHLLSLASSITNAIQVEGIRPSPRPTLPRRGFDNSRQCVLNEKYIIEILREGRIRSHHRTDPKPPSKQVDPSLRRNLLVLWIRSYNIFDEGLYLHSIPKNTMRIIIIANERLYSWKKNSNRNSPSVSFSKKISKMRYQFSLQSDRTEKRKYSQRAETSNNESAWWRTDIQKGKTISPIYTSATRYIGNDKGEYLPRSVESWAEGRTRVEFEAERKT